MKLREYMTAESVTPEAMAKRLKISKSGVLKYYYEKRIPRPAMMARIYAVTKGAVAASDFYGQDSGKVPAGRAA